MVRFVGRSFFFFFNDTATTEIYTLSLHDALPISRTRSSGGEDRHDRFRCALFRKNSLFRKSAQRNRSRSEEHTSELQSHLNLVCRLLLEKKKKYQRQDHKLGNAIRSRSRLQANRA